jgi:Sulfatase
MAAEKPNILVIWGDDIGITNLSCYSDGLMGYRTPNIDRIADEGMRFTDSKLFNLRTDPFERADVTSNTYWDWLVDNGILVLTASAVVAQFLETFKEFPPRQHAASFTIDQAVAKLEAALTAGQ